MRKFIALIATLALLQPALAAGPFKPLVINGGKTVQLPASSALQLNATGTGAASINMPHGTAPSAPVNGDCWTTSAGLYCRINGSTVGPYSTGTGTGSVTTSGSPASGNLAKFSGSTAITNGDLSGDITTSGALATTLATVNSNVGSFGSATNCPSVTVNGKGLVTAASQATCTPAFSSLTGAATLAQLPSTAKIRSFGTTFGDTTGSALSSGSVVYFTVPYACTISAWNITVDAGTVTFDIWKIASGSAIPTVSNTITASALPALSTGTALHSTTLTGWTTSVTANDIVGIQLNTVATAKYAEIDVECDQ